MSITPKWMISYMVHGHNNTEKCERTPHVHINVDDCEAIVNLDTCQYITGEDNIPLHRRGDVLEWVRENQHILKKEWWGKSNPYG